MNDASHLCSLIDRLAVGELDESARTDLFAWLNREPAHWRRCALALLEAREIEQALGAWRAEAPRQTLTVPRVSVPQHSRWPAVIALAASIMLAFSLGIFVRGFWAAPTPLIVKVQKPSGGESPSPAMNEKPRSTAMGDDAEPAESVTAVAAASAIVDESGFIPPYVRGKLARRGYQLTSRHGQVPVVLPDGRRVMVPVDQLQVSYVGQRTY